MFPHHLDSQAWESVGASYKARGDRMQDSRWRRIPKASVNESDISGVVLDCYRVGLNVEAGSMVRVEGSRPLRPPHRCGSVRAKANLHRGVFWIGLQFASAP